MLTELTPAILVESCQLPRPFHGDPADQMIVASARHHTFTIVTKDRRLRTYPHVQTIW
jgi:PIN domain nuclease of toxin-antitoxin system